MSFENDDRQVHWSSAAKFDEDKSQILTQLPSLAAAAYNEMLESARDDGVRHSTVMAAFAVGQWVYFSSSLRGDAFLVNPGERED